MSECDWCGGDGARFTPPEHTETFSVDICESCYNNEMDRLTAHL